MTTALLILACIVALSILVLLWLIQRAPVIDEPDMSWPGKPFRVIEGELAETVPSLDERYRKAEGV